MYAALYPGRSSGHDPGYSSPAARSISKSTTTARSRGFIRVRDVTNHPNELKHHYYCHGAVTLYCAENFGSDVK